MMISKQKSTVQAVSIVIVLTIAFISTSRALAAWNAITVSNLGDYGQYNSLALDASGNPVISFYDSYSKHLKLIHCDDPQCAGTETPVTIADDVSGSNSLVLRPNGNPVIAYQTQGDYKGLWLARCSDVNCTGKINKFLLESGSFGHDLSLKLDSNGNPVISYYASVNANLKVIHCDTGNCSSKTIRAVDTIGMVGLGSSLALDSNNRPVITYYDATNRWLRLVHCNDIYCDGPEGKVTLATTASHLSSLVLDSSGNPVIAYSVGYELRLMHCTDPKCIGAKSSVIIDNEANGGHMPSLKLDANGYPVISYYWINGADLRLAQCHDANCVNKTISTVDESTFVGWFNSLALNASGKPIISYYDSRNSALKLGFWIDD